MTLGQQTLGGPPLSPDYGEFKDVDTSNSPNDPFLLRDSILSAFTLKQLKQNGYINYDQTSLPTTSISAVFKPGPETTTVPIHRIFQRSNWRGTDDTLWEQLQPSLQIATRFFNELGLNHFFQSLIWGPEEDIVHPVLTKAIRRPPRKFGHLDEAERRAKGVWHDHQDTCKALTSMHSVLQFQWEDLGYYGANNVDPSGKKGLDTQTSKDRTAASIISIDRSFIKALSPNTHFDLIPFAKKEQFGHEEALLRARLVLAITLVHETCHAIFVATNESLVNENFYRDHRLAEIGYAFESILFNGAMDSIGSNNPGVLAAYYGLSSLRWPGAAPSTEVVITIGEVDARERMEARGIVPPPIPPLQLQTAVEANVYYNTFYLLPMTWVRQFFTDEFWDRDVPRLGLNAYDPPRRVGIREYGDNDPFLSVEVSPLPAEQTLPAEK